MKIRDASLEELAPPPPAKPKQLSAREAAALERQHQLRKALDRAEVRSGIVAIDLEANDKLPTIRFTLVKMWQTEPRKLNVLARGKTIYVSKDKLPGKPWRLGV